MAFCGICKRNHDPDLPCTAGTEQILRNMGLKKEDKSMSQEEFKKNDLKAKKFLFLFWLIVIVAAMFYGIFFLFNRK